MNWVPMTYRGYWDVPRIILARHGDHSFLLDCPFDDEADDYPDDYTIYLMPAGTDETSVPQDWTGLHRLAERRLGTIPVGAVRFDQFSRPRYIGAEVFDLLPLASPPANGIAERPAEVPGVARPVG